MKRNRLKLKRIGMGALCIVLSLGACDKDTLVFPPATSDETVVTTTRPTARPDNLTFVLLYNQQVAVFWPELSDRVAKAKISYMDADGEKSIEVTEFDEPLSLSFKKFETYTLDLTYYTADGVASKTSKVSIKPLPYEVVYKAEGVRAEQLEGAVRFIFPTTYDRSLSYKIAYHTEDEDREKLVTGTDIETIVVDRLFDDSKEIDFTITVSDAELGQSATTVIRRAPGALPYKEIIPSFIYYLDGQNGGILWNNHLGEEVTVKVTYLLNGITKTAEVTNKDAIGNLTFDLQGHPSQIQVTLINQDGASTTFSGSINAPTEMTDKSSWTATVSDTQAGDGGGAAALIDNDITTYWHSQWSPSIPFPHWFNIDFGKVRLLSKISMIRRGTNTNGFVLYNLEISVDGVSYVTVAKDLSFDPTNGSWQDYTLPNIRQARYVRITMTQPRNAADAFTHLGEFSAFGY